ncbi:unnamed protein product [Bursaphelenchus okinawaensis]|uniref:G_PROTEIN_RECEP_F1_2 domain-containing protein n=1 Tax=Bursaphelenchus okinawaensis TaxID=465554 RepID=A0A811KKV6_9BILA|nr:unnamed protein product [Bursaphelenchus okinawaensis]CAG9105315.1 unnamed protein product [Bursaphelenchus okinawaensis]
MVNFVDVYKYSDLIASILGLMINVTLMTAIFRTNRKGFHAYSYLLIVPCLNDFIFSSYQLLVQHLIKVDKGTIYIFPHGIERLVPENTYWIFAFFHLFTITNTFTTQPAIYHYRYVLITKVGQGGPTLKLLLRNICISVIGSSIVGVCFAASIQQTFHRGKEFYIRELTPLWFNPDGSTGFLYASNWDDLITKIYVASVVIVYSIANILAFYLIIISVKSVHVQTASVSENTRHLRSQFTKTLISQTLVLTVLALIPCTIYMAALVFQLRGEYLGSIVLGPVSWFPCINGLLPMYFVRAIRGFVLGLVGIHKGEPTSINIKSNNTSTVSSASKVVEEI